MALLRTIPDIREWNITILATDINPKILQKAKRGIYGKWSFRNVPDWLKERYFLCEEKETFEILSRIKGMVTFEYLNLADDNYPSPLTNTHAMDIIFCRNVLMYFAQEKGVKVVNGFYNSLRENGYLIVSVSELSLPYFSRFKTLNCSNAFFHQKELHKATAPAVAAVSQNSFVKPAPPLIKTESISKPVKRISKPKPQIQQIKNAPAMPEKKFTNDALSLYARGCYEEVINLPAVGNSSDELLLKIRAYANLGKLKEARGQCEAAIAADKLNPKLYFMQGIILLDDNKTDDAALALKRVIYLDPNFVIAHFTLGNIYLRLGNNRNADKHFSNVLTLLTTFQPEEIVPESDGLKAGRLKEIVTETIHAGVLV